MKIKYHIMGTGTLWFKESCKLLSSYLRGSVSFVTMGMCIGLNHKMASVLQGLFGRLLSPKSKVR